MESGSFIPKAAPAETLDAATVAPAGRRRSSPGATARRFRKTFPNKAEAKTWRTDANAQLSKGGLRAPKPTTVKEAWEAWYEAAKVGTVRNRKGEHFKPSALRSYESSMRLRVLPLFGETRVADLDRVDLQRYVYRLLEEGHAPTTIDGTLLPLRALCRQAVERGELAINPCSGLSMPRGERRTRPDCRPRRGCRAGRGPVPGGPASSGQQPSIPACGEENSKP